MVVAPGEARPFFTDGIEQLIAYGKVRREAKEKSKKENYQNFIFIFDLKESHI